ncbi:ArsR/SmtB family transcription factor [Desulfovibrio gilichinskyi]|uniref:Transcriptional regulator, ArsR family n=1 Tax=Desulfovibrio gilichinskyi TaxID=1519643 RepID=A0A1X7DHA4_9BACT|nr:metalloregulator ArsR/SmtB family transcription factor [Desulfovibrio gilichinskyi]SMF15244.1 transcriptional regulator, ArsR family [Desulfovibrio gilichinskyi]
MTNTNQQKQPSRDEINLAKVLQALSDQVRLQIVLKLANESEIQCGCFGLDIPKSSLSHHFKVLRESGVVTTRREGKELFNSLRMDDLEARFPGVVRAVIEASRNAGISQK